MFSFDHVIFQLKINYNILVILDLKNKQTKKTNNLQCSYSPGSLGMSAVLLLSFTDFKLLDLAAEWNFWVDVILIMTLNFSSSNLLMSSEWINIFTCQERLYSIDWSNHLPEVNSLPVTSDL